MKRSLPSGNDRQPEMDGGGNSVREHAKKNVPCGAAKWGRLLRVQSSTGAPPPLAIFTKLPAPFAIVILCLFFPRTGIAYRGKRPSCWAEMQQSKYCPLSKRFFRAERFISRGLARHDLSEVNDEQHLDHAPVTR